MMKRMPASDLFMPNEVRAAYREGEESVARLVKGLMALIQEQSAQIQEQAVRIQEQAARIQELEARLNKDSHNSSKPPTSDGLKKGRKHSLRQKSGKKTGGQAGHAGHWLEPVRDPQHIIEHRVTHCQKCHASLAGVKAETYEMRQVFDLPEKVELEVTEHRVAVVHGPHCEAVNQAEYPEGVSQKTQYGPRVRAQMVYFNTYQLVPLERTAEIIADLYQQAASEGAVLAAVKEVAHNVEPVNEVACTRVD
jgi:transposase